MPAAAHPDCGTLAETGNWLTAEIAGPEALGALDALAAEWTGLGQGPAAPFTSPEWLRAHICAFEPAGKLVLVSARYRGRLAAVLPLVSERGWFRGLPVRRLRGAAGVHSLRFDVAALPGAIGRQATLAIGGYLRRRGGWDVIELRDVPAGGAAEALQEDARAHGYLTGRWVSMNSPYIELSPADGGSLETPRAERASPAGDRSPPPSDQLRGPQREAQGWQRERPSEKWRATSAGMAPGMQGTKGAFRTELRRTRRHLETAAADAGGKGQLRLVTAPVATAEERAHALEAFYTLEASGWKGRQHSAIACRPAARRFYDLAATAMAASGRLVLHRLELDGRTIAMSYSLCDGDEYNVIKWCYDETLARFGPGHLLIEAIIRDVADCTRPEAGPALRRLHINGPEAAYKRKWTQTGLSLSYLYIFPPHATGRLLHRLKFDWTPRLQRLQRRLQRLPRRGKPT